VVSDTLGILAAVDRLYEGVVMEPESWNERAFADWAEELAAGDLSRDQARGVRRCLRMAQRLRAFWVEGGSVVVAEDWRTRVDVALGPRAWRPTLELARDGLDDEPSPELFELVRERFRSVNSEPWLEGVSYEEWLARG
jgi:hypothetical protein